MTEAVDIASVFFLTSSVTAKVAWFGIENALQRRLEGTKTRRKPYVFTLRAFVSS